MVTPVPQLLIQPESRRALEPDRAEKAKSVPAAADCLAGEDWVKVRASRRNSEQENKRERTKENLCDRKMTALGEQTEKFDKDQASRSNIGCKKDFSSMKFELACVRKPVHRCLCCVPQVLDQEGGMCRHRDGGEEGREQVLTMQRLKDCAAYHARAHAAPADRAALR